MQIEGVTKIVGTKEGKTIGVLVGVHGNEVCGPKALEQLLPALTIDLGTVYFIYGNPRALDQNARQTEMNLNRAFKATELLNEKDQTSYEHKRALELMGVLKQCEVLFDIHSSSTKNATPFIICEPHSFDIAKQLPVPILSYGWDALEPGGTDHYMNTLGKKGICIECGYHLDNASVEKAQESILQFLSVMGAIHGPVQSEFFDQRIIHVYSTYHTKVNFTPIREFADFEVVKAQEEIGTDGETMITADEESVIIFPRKLDVSNKEAFILGKEE